MGKLKRLVPSLRAVKPVLGYASRQDADRARDRLRRETDPCRKLYSTKRWRDLRMRILTRDLFTCQNASCGRVVSDTSELVCDHIEPHCGDVAKFWAGPFQTLCKRCHDKVKQSEEIAAGYRFR